MVEGFGNKNICLSNPRLGDTKLFFLKMGKMRQDRSGQVLKFKLNDNILKINLRNQKLLTKLRDRRMKKKMIYQNIYDSKNTQVLAKKIVRISTN